MIRAHVACVCERFTRSKSGALCAAFVVCGLYVGGFWILATATLQISLAQEVRLSDDHFAAEVQPLLREYCFDCHADGTYEGGVALDTLQTLELAERRELWWRIVKNLRARIMPPADMPQLDEKQFHELKRWAQTAVFQIDPENPDPGQLTLRRLNRAEYANTIRDLVGVEFDTQVEFPPDDTGYGFDTIGDVLTVSPLLLEKYVQAAESIIAKAVPTASRTKPVLAWSGQEFESGDQTQTGERISFYDQVTVRKPFSLPHAGTYQVEFRAHVDGEFAFDPGRCRVSFDVDSERIAEDEFVYAFSDDPDRGASFSYAAEMKLASGDHELVVRVTPLVDESERLNRLDFGLQHAQVSGPENPQHWVEPARYRDFFPDGPIGQEPSEQRRYAREVLERFGLRAYRRPLQPSVVEALVDLAAAEYTQPGVSFETGVSRAMIAMLSSPRFLFRINAAQDSVGQQEFPLVDEWTLASRLSYFLWSTMPDQELFDLAQAGLLREQLDDQIVRMLADERASAFVSNFTGQWLQSRNVTHAQVDPRAALGVAEEADNLAEKWGAALWGDETGGTELEAARTRIREILAMSGIFNADLRSAMRRETEMAFEYVLMENRDVIELIDADYVFANAALAQFYGLPPVEGNELVQVSLPDDSPRGGVLTQGSMLVITSNPTRTSPVKRGLFILENILGTPTPPAPPDIPDLEESAEQFADTNPSFRQLLAKHREDPLCSSCHSRIDPLGLAFEKFTAIGSWRDQEFNEPIDASGTLVSGETFEGVGELKQILRQKYRLNFYRCLAEKLLTYAVGRGMDYTDEVTIDRIVAATVADGGQFQTLLRAIVSSSPFQRMRAPQAHAALSSLSQ